MIDLHVHILPGLDDGPSDPEESLAMCRLAVEDGTTVLVATPHMCDGLYDVPPDAVLRAAERLQQDAAAAGLPLRILPGGDIHAQPDLPARLRARQALTIADGGKYVMVEFSHAGLPPGVEELLFALHLGGITPIITHPERNGAIQENPGRLRQLVEAGNLVQVTAGSLTGAFGRRVERCARRLLTERLVHVVASDAHSAGRRAPGLCQARQVVEMEVGLDEAAEIFDRRPEQVLNGQAVTPSEPVVEPRTRAWRGIWPWRRG